MSAYLYLFIRAENPSALTVDLQRILGTTFRPTEGAQARLATIVGHVVVEVEDPHRFGAPDHEDPHLPLSRYPIAIVFRLLDSARSWHDADALARRVFEDLRLTGRYQLLLSYDFQDVLAAWPPVDPDG